MNPVRLSVITYSINQIATLSSDTNFSNEEIIKLRTKLTDHDIPVILDGSQVIAGAIFVALEADRPQGAILTIDIAGLNDTERKAVLAAYFRFVLEQGVPSAFRQLIGWELQTAGVELDAASIAEIAIGTQLLRPALDAIDG